MTPEQKAWIDNATYIDMLAKVRFAPLGYFANDTEHGRYAWARVIELNRITPQEEKVSASKRIGWDEDSPYNEHRHAITK